MSQVHLALENLIGEKVSLSTPQISQGAKSHNYVRQLLANKWEADRNFPRLISEADFLSGSYARGTKIYPLDDIDVMVVIDGTGLFAVSGGQILNAEVRGTGEERNPILRQLGTNGLLSSKRVLRLFGDALRQSHPSSQVAKDNQAVNVWLESYGLGIDIVPCFHIRPRDGSQDFYYIPAGGSDEGWIQTNPEIDARISDAFVKAHGNEFTNLVRLIKYWNKVYNADRLRSYHLETVVWYVFSNHTGPVTSYDEWLSHFFHNCSNLLSQACPDATRISGPIDTYLSLEARSQTLKRIEETRQAIRSAELLKLMGQGSALRPWGRIFNEAWA